MTNLQQRWRTLPRLAKVAIVIGGTVLVIMGAGGGTSTSTPAPQAADVPPPPSIVSVMYGFERHCPANPVLQSRLINKEVMLIPNKAEAQRAIAIAAGDALAQRPGFCAKAELLLTVAVQSGQYLDEQLNRAIRCIDVQWLDDAEAMQCPRYWRQQ